MKQFFKFVLATIVGVFVAGLVVLVAFVGIIVAASADKEVKIDDNSILTISLKNAVPERTPNNPLANLGFLGFDDDKSVGLNDILASIKKAKDDKQIKGIYLADNLTLSGQATTEEIRNALIDFKKSKKFIIAYAEVYTQSSYYLASVADKVYMNPKGIFDFAGMSSQITFFKGALDKLGVEAQVIKVGTYKSAVEPFILDKMSDANREQVTSYLGSLNDQMLTGIGNSRHINVDSLFSIANNLKVRMPEDAVTYKLVDGLKYKDEVLNELKSLTKVDLKKNLHSVSIESYAQNDGDDKNDGDKDSDDQIAMVYASGEINGGNGDDNTIGSERISTTLRQARLNDKVKAVVLRVNSPGGSSLASDVIWREVSLTKKVKPVIVSMGDYAASGGYYIACAADSIYAEPNTITGSIGIFAILPNMRGLLTGKLGLTFDGVKTGKYADLGDVTRPLTPEERAILQNQVNRGYSDFTGAVAAGRKKTPAYINSIGQGRVWTGEQAIKIGLVDRLGNINDAVASAAKKAGLNKYKLVEYPEQKSFFKSLSNDLQSHVQTRLVKAELGESYTYYQQLKSMQQMMHTPQARLPFFATMK